MYNDVFTNDRSGLFKVYEEPVISAVSGIHAPKKKMLFTKDENDNNVYLSVVNKSYRVVENQEILEPLQQQIANYFDPSVLETIKIKDVVSKSGASCFFDYTFPKVAKEIETRHGHNTTVGLRFILKNSFDGSGAITLYGGAIDFFCTNGSIRGEYDVAKKRHTSSFEIEGFIQYFDDIFEKFKDTVDVYQTYANTKVSNTSKVMTLLNKLVRNSEDDAKRRNSLSERLFAQYIDESENRGHNVFSVMSALTHYSSHDDDRFGLTKRSDGGTLYKRQAKVANWLASETWEQFVKEAA